ncbi:PD-(D/E)XK nuclease family protein [Maribacter sp. 2307ULW6-5]|uniref:PD-(D/E)XK nuclease family protein n=1 Tax=Maribacter sp. 2307ULW6-5 TaxID=3386275 RepID=UPI0039BC9742
MRSFLEEVVASAKGKYGDLGQVVFVLPNKRAGNFLRAALGKASEEVRMAPEIYSIEEFVEQLSGIAYAPQDQLLFLLYESYLKLDLPNKDTFEAFLKWAPTLLQDFNEVDRHLVNAKDIFGNLADVQELNHWSLAEEKTQLVQDYLKFWNSLYPLYQRFAKDLLAKGLGNQGMVYRRAVDSLAPYLELGRPHCFVGFNALNAAESRLIRALLESSNSTIYWDIDPYFLDDPVHDAGFFIRRYREQWNTLKDGGLEGVHRSYLAKKEIRVFGVSRSVAQAKYVGKILQDVHDSGAEAVERTALVLGDENLLQPIMNAIPQSIPHANITMGMPLSSTPLASYFLAFLELLRAHGDRGWFHKDLLGFLEHPGGMLDPEEQNGLQRLAAAIKEANRSYVDKAFLTVKTQGRAYIVERLMEADGATISQVLTQLQLLITHLRKLLSAKEDAMAMEELYRIQTVVNRLEATVERFPFVKDMGTLVQFFKELLAADSLDYEGEPLQGLQIMGMLESRNLDFETVIITSVNEGILPAGKVTNSFVPHDLKLRYGLPTYKEKDAVYTYHFYRLLQRAKKVYLLYNTEPDSLEGGERSRLITQLLTDPKRTDVREVIVAAKVGAAQPKVKEIPKTPALMELLREKMAKGLSPSALGNYIRDPMTFYKQDLLGIGEMDQVEETMAANTFGTIVHDALETLYTPILGDYITPAFLKGAKQDVPKVVKRNFDKTYGNSELARGKNYLSYHVIQQYIQRFLDQEMEHVEQNRVKLLGLELNLRMALPKPLLGQEVFLHGKLDRVEQCNGEMRIIDYKTGRVNASDVSVFLWEDIWREDRHKTAFQLLCYALMFSQGRDALPMRAGIVSFKNLAAGTMFFAKKASARAREKDPSITKDTLDAFLEMLYALLYEMTDTDIPFKEKK